MPGEWLGVDGVIEMYGNSFDVRVIHDRIGNLVDLRKYLNEIFADEFVNDLFASFVEDGAEFRRFVDVDGALHTLGADRGTNMAAGEIRYTITRQSADEIVFQLGRVPTIKNNQEVIN